ncbi:hypothetical protein [Streptomyces sp. I05A-00742]|uniref:hypothetical protein n=1 Tax=Streptomyces sp. I05A-00742 TaxID=2732853 RepID=UPI00148765E9|nr:hypothetical protein [Streptomyces sp. I05A-00742]
MGRIAHTVLTHLDTPPSGPAPTRWGDPGQIRPWFAPLPAVVRTRVRHVQVAYPSGEHAVRVFENKPDPLRAHRAALRAALTDLFRAGNGPPTAASCCTFSTS